MTACTLHKPSKTHCELTKSLLRSIAHTDQCRTATLSENLLALHFTVTCQGSWTNKCLLELFIAKTSDWSAADWTRQLMLLQLLCTGLAGCGMTTGYHLPVP